MKKILAALLLTLAFASPAFAATKHHHHHHVHHAHHKA
jgi:predicted S18 family serine protease